MYRELAKLVLLISRCLNCKKFPCNFIIQKSEREPLDGCIKEYESVLKRLNNVDRKVVEYLFCKLISRVVPSGLPTLEKFINVRYFLCKLCIDNVEHIVRILLKSLGLDIISDYVIDNNVEDIYITNRGVFIMYRGGIIRKVDVDKVELYNVYRSILNLASLSGCDVTFDEPSALFSINIKNLLRIRVSLDVWPCVEDFVIHLRIHRKPYTIDDLLRFKMINISTLSKILKYVKDGYSLIIFGPPCSGKTTLLNALVLEFLKIKNNVKVVCIDEVDELWFPDNFLVVKYRSIFGRVREIEKVLHRGGGILIIGELREKDHFEAYRIAINSGLQVFTTIHGSDVRDVFEKFRIYMNSVDDVLRKCVLVSLDYRRGVRRVSEVYLLSREVPVRSVMLF